MAVNATITSFVVVSLWVLLVKAVRKMCSYRLERLWKILSSAWTGARRCLPCYSHIHCPIGRAREKEHSCRRCVTSNVASKSHIEKDGIQLWWQDVTSTEETRWINDFHTYYLLNYFWNWFRVNIHWFYSMRWDLVVWLWVKRCAHVWQLVLGSYVREVQIAVKRK